MQTQDFCIIDGCAKRTAKFLCDRHWFQMPLRLRQLWWKETQYSRRAPSATLVVELNRLLATEKEPLDV